ncbi:Hypothetical protein AJAP_37950 [Amycolatopsis japonica]|uniref:Uncharacterized protein n=1 Tax=Amycolatopsis japonica TaxID=208439 RepID=A0A075V7I4_9PSEU|nr:Hypothetical protein AJAP_37950 [Amycolatopsis japonica]
MVVPFTVGFDLEMTLIDSRPGMTLAIDTLAEETGFATDGAHFAVNLRPPLDAWWPPKTKIISPVYPRFWVERVYQEPFLGKCGPSDQESCPLNCRAASWWSDTNSDSATTARDTVERSLPSLLQGGGKV